MSSEYDGVSLDEMKRTLLWEPCETKEQLHYWCKAFLGIDFPDHVVSRHSNSSPMDAMWEAYDLCRHSDPEAGAYHIMVYAARTSFKTLMAAAFEVLATLHLDRDVSHMAAIESQAQKAQSYVKHMFRRPHIRPFVIGDNKREILIRRYVDRNTGHSLTEKEWKVLTAEEQQGHKVVERSHGYEEDDRYIKIIICTTQGANSEHTAVMIVDEVDVIPNVAAFEESKSIPEGRGEQIPLTLMISTRKSATGLVQKEIDGAVESGLMVRHWNLVDITKRSLDASTLLFTTGGVCKQIDAMIPGDMVVGVDDEGREIETMVFALFDHGMVEGIEVTFDDGYQVVCSLAHKYLTYFGQLSLRDILDRGLDVLCGRSEKIRRLDGSVWGQFPVPSGVRCARPSDMSSVSRDLETDDGGSFAQMARGPSGKNEGDHPGCECGLEEVARRESRGIHCQSCERDRCSQKVARGESG